MSSLPNLQYIFAAQKRNSESAAKRLVLILDVPLTIPVRTEDQPASLLGTNSQPKANPSVWTSKFPGSIEDISPGLPKTRQGCQSGFGIRLFATTHAYVFSARLTSGSRCQATPQRLDFHEPAKEKERTGEDP
jgi:hypothetical protein